MALDYQEVKIATMGNVSAGKSTLLGVLTKNILDNGRGLARKNICKYPHEDQTGKTSAIGHHYIVYKKNNKVYKTTTFFDLAGHEKYIKTTVSGLSGTLCDYVMLMIGSNMGVSKMTKEHFNIAKILNKPIIIVITKIDLCPDHVLNNTINDLKEILLSKFAGERKPWFINNPENSLKCAKIMSSNQIIYPVFKISNVTGENIENLKLFIENLSPPVVWNRYNFQDAIFVVDDTFHISGIGCVISGTMKRGTVSINDKLWIGPFNDKTGSYFKQILIKSIHGNIRNPIDKISAGYTGAFAIRSLNKKDLLKRKNIKKGTVVMANPYCINEFTANCVILHHPTTIKVGYQPVIHCGNVRQSAKIIEMDKELTRTGDETKVRFRFSFNPEYIEVGSKIIFREGRTKGIGTITNIVNKL